MTCKARAALAFARRLAFGKPGKPGYPDCARAASLEGGRPRGEGSAAPPACRTTRTIGGGDAAVSVAVSRTFRKLSVAGQGRGGGPRRCKNRPFVSSTSVPRRCGWRVFQLESRADPAPGRRAPRVNPGAPATCAAKKTNLADRSGL